jgi:hypothetical protein
VRRPLLAAIAAIAAITAITLTACGGDEAPEGDRSSPEATSTNVATTAAGDAVQPTTGGSPSARPGYALLTIGDERYEFDMADVAGQCRSTGSAIVGSFNLDADGRPIPADELSARQSDVVSQVNFDIPSPDAPDLDVVPPRILVVDNVGSLLWLAGADAAEEVDPEHSRFESWTLVDGVAQGTALFAELRGYDASESPRGTSGTFDIVCGS